MGKVVMYASVSVDGFIADENDQPGPLFDWLTSGDVPLDESGVLKVSQTSYDYIRPYWDQIGATIAGRHVFDLTDGWDGTPPAGVDYVVVVTPLRLPWSRRRSLRVTAWSRSPPATSEARCLPRVWSTRCAWTSYPWCSGPASATSGRSMRSTCWRILT
jgi:hypothetical protein